MRAKVRNTIHLKEINNNYNHAAVKGTLQIYPCDVVVFNTNFPSSLFGRACLAQSSHIQITHCNRAHKTPKEIAEF